MINSGNAGYRCSFSKKKKKKKKKKSGTSSLIISNEEIEDFIKIAKSLEESQLLIEGISETIKNEVK